MRGGNPTTSGIVPITCLLCLYKLAWNLVKKEKHWATFLQARFMHSQHPIQYYKSSSIWSGIKSVLPVLQQDLAWALGYNSKCRLWYDYWTMAGPLIDRGPIPLELLDTKSSTVGEFVENFKLVLPSTLSQYMEVIGLDIADIAVPLSRDMDELIWMKGQTGTLTIKDAYSVYRTKSRNRPWLKKLWQRYLPPKFSVFAWKIATNSLPTDFNALIRGVDIYGGCAVCENQLVLEDQDHLFIHCDLTKAVWSWFSLIVNLDMSFVHTAVEMIRWCTSGNLANQYNEVIQAACFIVMWQVWKARNKLIFQGKKTEFRTIIMRTKKHWQGLVSCSPGL